jgi:hypothetical protein
MKTSRLDVHKDSVFCAVYDGKNYSAAKGYETTTPKIRQLGEYLRTEGGTVDSVFVVQEGCYAAV